MPALRSQSEKGYFVNGRIGVQPYEYLQPTHVTNFEKLDIINLQLDGQDLERIENILTRSNDLYRLIGDCGDEYRLS
jgi:hypothetical protein